MLSCMFTFAFFFFKQKTAYEMRISDWSSDVCSSDLHRRFADIAAVADVHAARIGAVHSRAWLDKAAGMDVHAPQPRVDLMIEDRRQPFHQRAVWKGLHAPG